MGEQYKGNFLVGLMRTIDTNLRRKETNQDIPESKVEIGGRMVKFGPFKIRVGPEVIDSWKRIEAKKQAAITSGEPFTLGKWQSKNPMVKVVMKAVARKAGFPGIYD